MTNEEAWDFAIGMASVDGEKPSDEFMELVEREKRGEITTDDIRKFLNEKYAASTQDTGANPDSR